MKTLIITEKPSVAKDFAKALKVSLSGRHFFSNENYIITWALGHLLELYDPEDYVAVWKYWKIKDLPILPKPMKLKERKDTKSQLLKISHLIKAQKNNKIIVATDAGREGELIARTLLTYSKYRGDNVYRFWSSQALIPSVIHKELKNLNPLSKYDPLFFAGRARQKADWLVGINLSRLMTLKCHDLFTIGRVQTAILSLIAKRKKDRDQFKSEKYFHITANFKFNNKSLNTQYYTDETMKILSKRKAEEILLFIQEEREGVLFKKMLDHRSIHSPYLYSITELQKDANIQFGLTAKATLDHAQELYEKYKCLSYPRTDSKVLGETSLPLIQELALKLRDYKPSLFKYWTDSKVSLSNKYVFNDTLLTDHHALIPTDKPRVSLPHNTEKIYDLVFKRFCQAFSNNYRYDELKYFIKIGPHHFKTRGKVILSLGWKGLEKYVDKEILLPPLNENAKGSLLDATIKNLKTSPPQKYTEALLLHDLMNPAQFVDGIQLKKIFKTEVGLGTQATRAQMIETLLKRKYIVRSQKILEISEKGVYLIEELLKNTHLKKLASPKETAIWEDSLEKIRKGELSENHFLKEIQSFIEDCILYSSGLGDRQWEHSHK